MIASVATAGAGRWGLPAPANGDQRSATMATIAPGWSHTQGVMPVKPQIEAASGYERGVRVKLPLLLGAVAAALLAAVGARRSRLRRQHSSRPPVALRARSLPLRAPPRLLLG
jgi:hypothetical protein